MDQGGNSSIITDPVPHTFTSINIYPSNADIIYFSKLPAAARPNAVGAFSPFQMRAQAFGNTPAPRGHFIINAFNRNRQDVSGLTGIYDVERDLETDRPISVAFYASRVWYLMPGGKVYFSQILTDILNAPKCYQDADPTAEDINELIATDGGEIDVSGIARAFQLIVVGGNLIILADNGVWTISGTGEDGFTATSQEIRKITTIGAIGEEALVDAEGAIFYWSEGGIYSLAPDPVTGALRTQNITEQTIQTLYLDIPEAGKENARGFYDAQEKKILWMYNDTSAYDGILFKNNYNRLLVLDLVLNAFYTYTLDSTGDFPFISAMFRKDSGNAVISTEDVTDSTVVVTDGGVTVTSSISTPSISEIKTKFLTFVETSTDVFQYTFSELTSDAMTDWVAVDSTGVNYTSHAETGADIVEDLLTEKEVASPLYLFFKLTEKNFVDNGSGGLEFDKPSGCQMRAKWHWADSVNSGRWSDQEQVYRLQKNFIPALGAFDYGFEVVQSINQIRGKGRALSLRFDSETGKDFHLLGWSIPYTGMTAP